MKMGKHLFGWGSEPAIIRVGDSNSLLPRRSLMSSTLFEDCHFPLVLRRHDWIVVRGRPRWPAIRTISPEANGSASRVESRYDLTVPDYLPRDLGDAQWARAQGALIDFLNADLDLAFTWLRTADIDVNYDAKGTDLALSKVRAALNTIRRLSGRVESALAKSEIATRADELETALGRFRV